MTLSVRLEREIQLRNHKWNTAFGKRICWVEDCGDHYRALHPTKGFRYVSKKRVGEA